MDVCDFIANGELPVLGYRVFYLGLFVKIKSEM